MSGKVLVTDDNETLRMLMRELLETKLGLEVVEASDGGEAWEKLDAGLRPSLCILDERMPKITGLTLLAKLRGDPRFKQQKVMICTTVNLRSFVIKAANLGVDAVLLKPFCADDFLAQVSALLREPEATAVPPLEPIDDVLRRIGLDKEVYLRLLTSLSDDIQTLVQSFMTPSDVDDENLKLRIHGIKGAVGTLGALKLRNLFERLERIESFHSSAALAIVETIEEERLNLMAAKKDLEQNAMNS